jgi:ribosomal protein L13
MLRTTAAALLLSLPSAALFSLPSSSRGIVRPRCAASMVATVDSPIKSEWDSKKPIHVDTWVPKEADMANSNKQWWVIDAENMRLGRMATEIAKRLMGKHKVRPRACLDPPRSAPPVVPRLSPRDERVSHARAGVEAGHDLHEYHFAGAFSSCIYHTTRLLTRPCPIPRPFVAALTPCAQVTFFPGSNVGDYVIVINADKVIVSGAKFYQKEYFRHSGRPGGKTVESFEQLQKRIPERIVEKAVKGMLPKGPLGREQFRHLKVVVGAEHEHTAQSPIKFEWAEGSLAITAPTGKKLKTKSAKARPTGV